MTQQEQRICGIAAACTALLLIVGGAIMIPHWITEIRVRAQAQELARQLSEQLPELSEGRTEFLPERDAWGQEFEAVFVVGDYRRSVTVSSIGRDGVPSDDDISAKCSYTDVDKAVGDTIERGAKRVGKGFTDGVLESLKGDKDTGLLDRWRKDKE